MLAETDLNRLERQLSDFNLATKARQDALDELTLTYGKLLEDYRILRSDYEEEKESREKYKKLARGQDRNPFVLVLIDADGYVFEDSLIKGGAEGGIRAANLLHDTIRDRLSRRGHEYENCKVMVRAYTNLAGLSKTLARAGLVGHEARSLSPFCSNFTRAHDLFDFARSLIAVVETRGARMSTSLDENPRKEIQPKTLSSGHLQNLEHQHQAMQTSVLLNLALPYRTGLVLARLSLHPRLLHTTHTSLAVYRRKHPKTPILFLSTAPDTDWTFCYQCHPAKTGEPTTLELPHLTKSSAMNIN
ncbi:hypothetical protein KCU95_g13628, partial [Aureobasidium melanogenum]